MGPLQSQSLVAYFPILILGIDATAQHEGKNKAYVVLLLIYACDKLSLCLITCAKHKVITEKRDNAFLKLDLTEAVDVMVVCASPRNNY